MKKRCLVGLGCGVMMFGVVNMASANLITNGSFELGGFIDNSGSGAMQLFQGASEITGWMVETAEIAWVNTPNAWLAPPSDGNLFLDLTGWHDSSPFGGVSQSISTIYGQQYTLSFDLGREERYPGLVSVTATAGNTTQAFSIDSGTQWYNFTLDFVADQAITTVSFMGGGNSIQVGLDNVSVSPVPEPATMLLMGTGLAGLVGVRRKKKK